MADVEQICVELAENLSTITGIQTSGYLLSNPTPPAAEVSPGPTQYDRAMSRGLDQLTFTVRVFVGNTSDIGAQKRLYPMMAGSGAQSVKAALESDRTLDGQAHDLHVTECTGLRQYGRDGQAPVLGAEWTVVVYAPGDS